MAKPKNWGMDEKDQPHNIPDPPTHHVIKCKHCGVTSETSTKYFYFCNECRNSQGYRRNTSGGMDSLNPQQEIRKSRRTFS